MNERKNPEARRAPDQQPLTEIQAARLAKSSGLRVGDLAKRTVAELRKDLQWSLDPELLLFRRICGRVVRTHPVTGVDEPVPGATVHVEDTDFNLFGFFPVGSPYVWFHPWGIRREEIATAVTDACGEFCVWVPRFDIDWVWRWRLERECFWEVFRKPSIADLLERLPDLVERPPFPWPPRPGPDPAPDVRALLRTGVDTPRALAAALGSDVVDRMGVGAPRTFGEQVVPRSLLDQPAFREPVPPPFSPRLDNELHEQVLAQRAELGDQVELAELADLAMRDRLHWYGPFLRCEWAITAELHPVFDIPDITFRVTQDVDNDGDEETIYSEGLFDVRWNSGPIPPVTLHASSWAVSTPTCVDQPDIGPCADPEIVLVGHMPLKNPPSSGTYPIVDSATGYAVRPNRPHGSGRADETAAPAVHATAPVAGLLELWGCPRGSGTTADRYRILRRTFDPAAGTWSSSAPIVDGWLNWRVVGSPSVLQWRMMNADSQGWYETLDPAEQWMPGHNYLLQWHAAPSGLHELILESGQSSSGGTTVVETAAPVRLRVDQTAPQARITSLAWRVLGGGGAPTALPLNCPTIHRGGQDIEVLVGYEGWATHLRSVVVSGGGCGGGSPELVSGFESMQSGVPAGVVTPSYWHKGPNDNNVSIVARFELPHSLPAGAYSFAITTHSRAFHPGDGHVYEPTQPDVGYNPAPIWTHGSIAIAVVD